MHILGNILIFIIIVGAIYAISSFYVKKTDKKRFEQLLQEEKKNFYKKDNDTKD